MDEQLTHRPARRGPPDRSGLPSPGRALPATRQLKLLELVQAQGQVTIQELTSLFRVSADTVRRDLDLLARQGQLQRTHGGGVATTNHLPVDAAAPRLQAGNFPIPHRPMARVASRLVNDGEALFMTGDSTVQVFAGALARRNLTVVTNSLVLPAMLPAAAVRDVYLLGGRYHRESQVTLSSMLVAGMSITIDCAVIAAGGITAKEGVTVSRFDEACLVSAMITAARRTIVLVEASRLGQRSFTQVCPLGRIQTLVSERAPTGDLAKALQEAEVKVVVVEG